ncbi:MAG TPA: hypothetical protein VK149_03450 [Sideroxyarcus sp.]|nr:hypothetical protein [Sideroxyarcus sp.]
MVDQVTQDAIRRATELAQRETTALDNRAMAELEKMYREAAADIQRIIQSSAGRDGTVSMQAMSELLVQIDARLKKLAEQRNESLKRAIWEAASLAAWAATDAAIAAMLYLAATRIPRMASGRANMSTPNVGLEISVGVSMQTGISITSEAASAVYEFLGPDGLRLSDRIWRLDRLAREVLADAIRQSVIQGDGAAAAALDFLKRGEPAPADITAQLGKNQGVRLGQAALELLTGEGGTPLYNAMRVFRTEINRAHIEAYRKSIQRIDGAIGTRFLLSPLHPEHDICDLHAEANLYGLGKGVYPFGKSPLPAHPNTISYEVVVFDDEVSEADRAGKESASDALQRLTPEQQIGVLGKKKYEQRTVGLSN